MWGSGYLIAAAAAALLSSHGLIPTGWAVCLGSALICGAYGMLWGGSRCFEGRRISAPLLAAGAAVWIAAFQLDSLSQSLPARLTLMSVITAAYALLGAREVWHAESGSVTVIEVGGDADLLTLREVRALQSADIIFYNDDVSPDVLEFARREARKILVGASSVSSDGRVNDAAKLMRDLAGQGKRVVRLKGTAADVTPAAPISSAVRSAAAA